ncbi:hypothetical protein PINS_up000780 [Pythium insidiosum]|nr:hypothetical protein PINS_up000780 [Pythium insidiosum]
MPSPNDVDATRTAADIDDRENEVLQFLLGKTKTIPSDDTSSVASTSSSLSASFGDFGFDDSAGVTGSHLRHACAVTEIPELEPISESIDEPAVCGSGSTVENSKKAAWMDDLQPEDEDTGLRFRSSAASFAIASMSKLKTVNAARVKAAAVAEWAQLQASAGKRARDLRRVALPSLADLRDVAPQLVALTVLLLYCVSIIHRFFYPPEWPLPDPSTLYTPWDVSNVTARIVYPLDGMDVHSPLQITGEFADFPTESIRHYGAETFEYRFWLDGRTIQHEVDYWSRAEALASNADTLKRVFQHRVDVSTFALDQEEEHELRLEVTFTIPGSDAQTKELSDVVRFRVVRPSTGPFLRITAPSQGATLLEGDAVVLTFAAHELHRVYIRVDGGSAFQHQHTGHGTLLLRRLSVGEHIVELEGRNERDEVLVTQTLRIEIKSRET